MVMDSSGGGSDTDTGFWRLVKSFSITCLTSLMYIVLAAFVKWDASIFNVGTWNADSRFWFIVAFVVTFFVIHLIINGTDVRLKLRRNHGRIPMRGYQPRSDSPPGEVINPPRTD